MSVEAIVLATEAAQHVTAVSARLDELESRHGFAAKDNKEAKEDSEEDMTLTSEGTGEDPVRTVRLKIKTLKCPKCKFSENHMCQS